MALLWQYSLDAFHSILPCFRLGSSMGPWLKIGPCSTGKDQLEPDLPLLT